MILTIENTSTSRGNKLMGITLSLEEMTKSQSFATLHFMNYINLFLTTTQDKRYMITSKNQAILYIDHVHRLQCYIFYTFNQKAVE